MNKPVAQVYKTIILPIKNGLFPTFLGWGAFCCSENVFARKWYTVYLCRSTDRTPFWHYIIPLWGRFDTQRALHDRDTSLQGVPTSGWTGFWMMGARHPNVVGISVSYFYMILFYYYTKYSDLGHGTLTCYDRGTTFRSEMFSGWIWRELLTPKSSEIDLLFLHTCMWMILVVYL